jgi:hypothetical protein
MIRRLILSVSLFYILSGNLFSQSTDVTIFGKNIEYAGKELEFFVYTERIFDETISLAKTSVDSSGAFSVSFTLDKTKCVYCQTPLYTAFIFAEPGKSYHVDMPPTPANANENSNNPFFIAPFWHMIPIAEANQNIPELNSAINKFNEQFEPFLDKQILRYYNAPQSREKLDSFMIASGKNPEPADKEYYQVYRQYKLATLGFMVNQFSLPELYGKYLKDKPVQSDIPSWWEFFNLYFDGYFSSLSVRKEFSELYPLIGKGKYNDLIQLLKKDSALQNDQIREWVILKEIHNAYYQNSLPLTTVYAICDSLAAASSDKVSLSMTKVLKKEASSLLPGNFPPVALLLNADGDSLDLASLHGKYTYIGFCSLDNLGCQKEFEYLKYFFHKHGKYLDLVIILPGSEKDRISSFTEENSIPWKFWYSLNDKKILNDYKVRAYPVFYLLNRDGKLMMSPAILPSAGFEQQLFNILKGKGEI